MNIILTRSDFNSRFYWIYPIIIAIAFVLMLTVASAYSALQLSKHVTKSSNNLALRVDALKNKASNKQHNTDFSVSWDKIAGKSIPSPSKTKRVIKLVSKKFLQKYRFRTKSLPKNWPLKQGRVSSGYGKRWRRMHRGIDIAAKRGTPIFAVEDGVVVRAKRVRGYGNLVEIKHSNIYSTRYGHNSKNLVKAGDIVKRGQKIALVGSTGRSTGPHVHFEIRQSKVAINPIKYLGAIDSFKLSENIKLSRYVKFK
ncbi:M23 family metallopeptidase [Candidatus Halobeggiatoa sp. HSG11]|nr:M23 family metallopeptidase [Candidatus Halobeggiatoa sp. HSG11]